MEPGDVPLVYVKQIRKGYYALYRISDDKLLAQSSNPRDLQAAAREAGYRQPGPDPQKYQASKILTEASHNAILEREALKQQKADVEKHMAESKRGPSDHPGDKWIRRRDRSDPTRGEMNRENQAKYDENMSKAKQAYLGFKEGVRSGLGNRGGRAEGHERQPSPKQPWTGPEPRERSYIDAKSQAQAEKRLAKEAKLVHTKDHGLVVYKVKENIAVQAKDVADAEKYAKKNGWQIVNKKEYLAERDAAATKPQGLPAARAAGAAKPWPEPTATQKAIKAKEAEVRNRGSKEAAEIAAKTFPSGYEASMRKQAEADPAKSASAAARAAQAKADKGKGARPK